MFSTRTPIQLNTQNQTLHGTVIGNTDFIHSPITKNCKSHKKYYLQTTNMNTKSTKTLTSIPFTSTTTIQEKFQFQKKQNLMFAAYLAQDKHGTMYTDLTRPFQVTSMSSRKYILAIYVYDANTMLLFPLKKRSDKKILTVYEDMYAFLKAHNCQTTLHILDNEASKSLKRMISQQQNINTIRLTTK